MAGARWQFWVDRGGTFTDVIAIDPDGEMRTAKLLSENPERYDDAAIAAIRELTGAGDGPLPALSLRIGTTIATNALLERKGEPVVLAITRGFGDALIIGTQDRPDIFAKQIVLPPPLFARVVEIDERTLADGTIERALDTEAARDRLQAAHDDGLHAVAIVLMHGYRYPAHETALAMIAREIGFTQISVSHEIAPLIKLVGRGDTSVADAYLSPVLRRYVAGLEVALGGEAQTLFMQSNGGLASGAAFHGKDAILSGPAGGIVGMAETARAAGFDRVIGFDMGGTSTDVSHYAGEYERETETRVAGARIRAPMLRIDTVAAGGGSICGYDGSRFTVGPHSAGAVPGPACYRRGGPLTVTDCNVMLGKIQPRHFPSLFGPNGDAPLDADVVRERFAALDTGLTSEAAAEGFVAIAVANMANAIKRVSIARGHDVSRYTLACFGGAGGQHACLVADALGITRAMIHPLGGILSAYGMGLADRRVLRERTLGLAIDDPAVAAEVEALAREAEAALVAQGLDAGAVASEKHLFLRHAGTESTIPVAWDSTQAMRAGFAERYRAQFGFESDEALVIDMAQAEAVARGASVVVPVDLPQVSAPSLEIVQTYMAGEPRETPLYDRAKLAAGFTTDGPAIVVDQVSTTVVEPGWRLTVDADGNLILERHVALARSEDAADPVRLEIFNGLFMGLAEEMGAALRHSAISVNIRERLDFSCAIFDAEGSLVANAPHMPVHLGSMGESVRVILARRRGEMRTGDVFALNAPYDGGTHLPDITVIMPVFVDGEREPRFFTAARGHHADIGGISPGSMPPGSLSLDEEGVVFDNVRIARDGAFLEDEIRAILGSGEWPSRNPDLNVADLKAQVAACAKGGAGLAAMSAQYGTANVSAMMAEIQSYSEGAVRRLIARLDEGAFHYAMDDGSVVAVTVTIDREALTATFDFTGSSAQHSGNFNAPLPVVRAAVLYVVRLLVDEAVPMNEGCLRPVRIIVPEGSMLSPRYPAAVVAGNVETSQVITDAILGALGAMAGSQGTMNNFTFGNVRHQYYETIAGGAGAGPGFDGASAVQTHMTNSRLTDPEILETRFPVVLQDFAIRRGSGGAGATRGGDGVVRRVRFLEAMEAGILSNRREVPPFGLAGGRDGACGTNRVERADGRVEALPAVAAARMQPGDVFVIETPGAGGCGDPLPSGED